jgi:serine protease Do
MKKCLLIVALSATTILAVAQESPTPKVNNPFSLLSSIFSPKPAALAKLIDEKKLFEIDDYLIKESQYFFVDNRNDQLDLLRKVGAAFNAMYEPEIEKTIAALSQGATPMPQDRWKERREALRVSDQLIQDYKKLQIFSTAEFRSPKLANLELTATGQRSSLKTAAPDAFVAFDHTTPADFFALYPLPLADDFLSKNSSLLQGYVAALSASQITQLKSKYPEKIHGDGKFAELLLTRFLALSLPESSGQPSMGKLLGTLKAARSAGFSVKKLPGSQIAFVEVTSKTLLAEGQIEFPTQIEMDMSFDPIKAELDTILDTTAKANANFVIILDVALSKVSRRIIAKNDMSSKFISGRRSEPNPAYEISRGKVFEAQSGLANAQAQRSVGLAGAILNGIAIGAWSSNLTAARLSMTNTPTMLQIDEFQDYKYSYSDIAATRALTANYFVIDKSANRYFKGVFDISENKSFRIAYNLHAKDPQGASILSKYGKEADIASYEKSPMNLPVSLLIEDYLKNESQSKPLQDVVALRDEMLTDKNKALTAYKSTQYTAKAVNDPRFDSVVVVNNPKGSLGTGFFVAPDLVLTNYHVIEGAQFIEMKMYNGLETFGKVVKTDVRLDLALIKVQTRGTPVSFFQGNILELGATVEAIGHPKGLTFTVTRGIVSAVRQRPSVYGVGGKDVLFVQTDAAINPGNSGGPLFLGDKFIGVNNNKLVAGSEGLGFSIHYSEISAFLKESF